VQQRKIHHPPGLQLHDHASGLCKTCRFITSKLERYTQEAWNVSFGCTIRAAARAPHAESCGHYEREPGTDDE
jgi:hypothetical protein